MNHSSESFPIAIDGLRLVPELEETVHGTIAAIRSGKRSCVSVVEQCLARIDACESQVRAWVVLDREAALAQARELDHEARSGRWRGPLHGIPLGIKDLIDVAGWPTGAGSELLSRTIVPGDAPLVARLRQAGAIILGKTVTTQFACFDPSVTRNPWNLERTPGGSSSGSAAAVATGMCLAAVGSQTGGSITRPASYCGVAGCKPTFGQIPIEGVYPVAHSLDHPGPIARCVADLAILVDVMSGSTRLTGDAGCVRDFRSRKVRIGRVRGLFDERAQPEVRSAWEAALERLTAAGATIRELPLPAGFVDVLRFHRQIMLYEIGQVHGRRFELHRSDYRPGLSGLIEESRNVSHAMYEAALVEQRALQQAMATTFADVSVLATPATTGAAPDLSTTGDPSFNSPWSFTGLPTVSFPITLSDDRLPLAIQLVGRPEEEPQLFAAAQWIESTLSGWTATPTP